MKAPELREYLLSQAEPHYAATLATEITNDLNHRLNALADQSLLTVGSSLLVRVMVARALVAVAAAWWAEVQGVPEPETFAALKSILDDPPPGMDGDVI